MNTSNLLDLIIEFVVNVGLEVKHAQIDEATFLSGILIENGVLIVDQSKLQFPGDLLHEAGHLAVLTPEDRKMAGGDLEPGDNKMSSLEMAAICWSWAASAYLGLEANVVFHDEGYKGQAAWLRAEFQNGNYIGLPLMQWMGFCKAHDDTSDLKPFPYMVMWLRE